MYPYDNQNNNGSANWDSDSGTYHYKYSNPQSNPDSGPEAPQRKPKKSHKGAGKVVALVLCCALVGGGAGVGGLAGEAMQLGVGLGTVGSVIGMTKEAISPIMQQSMSTGGWDCTCGQKDIMSNFCPNCGAKKPAPQMEGGWD